MFRFPFFSLLILHHLTFYSQNIFTDITKESGIDHIYNIFESGGLVLDGGTSTRDIKLRFNGNDALTIGRDGHVTASANISASGKLRSTGLEFGHFNNFLNFHAGGSNNTFKYNEWKQSASGGTTINNTAGTINFDSKGNADTMVISGSSVGIGTTTPGELLHVAGNITLGNNKKITFRDSSGNDGTSIAYDSNALFKITQANSGELRLNAGFNDNSNNNDMYNINNQNDK